MYQSTRSVTNRKRTEKKKIHGSAKPYTPSIQLTKEQSSHKKSFISQYLLWNEMFSIIKLISLVRWAGTHFFLPCDHSQPVGERTRGCLAAESFSLPHLALSHGIPSCVGGILKISLAKGLEPLQVWPEEFAQDDHCLMQAELKYWSEANLSVSLSFPVFHQKIYAAGELSRVRAAFGVEQNCTTPAISHICACLHKKGVWSCGFRKAAGNRFWKIIVLFSAFWEVRQKKKTN